MTGEDGAAAMTVPPEAWSRALITVQSYEPEAVQNLLDNPGALLSIMVETARRALEAAAPLIAATERERMVSDRAISAAGAAIERELLSGRDYSMSQDSDEALARVALTAVAALLGGVW